MPLLPAVKFPELYITALEALALCEVPVGGAVVPSGAAVEEIECSPMTPLEPTVRAYCPVDGDSVLAMLEPSAVLPICGGEMAGVVIKALETVEVLRFPMMVVG